MKKFRLKILIFIFAIYASPAIAGLKLSPTAAMIGGSGFGGGQISRDKKSPATLIFNSTTIDSNNNSLSCGLIGDFEFEDLKIDNGPQLIFGVAGIVSGGKLVGTNFSSISLPVFIGMTEDFGKFSITGRLSIFKYATTTVGSISTSGIGVFDTSIITVAYSL